jgi:hypothetical protein
MGKMIREKDSELIRPVWCPALRKEYVGIHM